MAAKQRMNAAAQLRQLAATHPANPKTMQQDLLREICGKAPVTAFQRLAAYAATQSAGHS
jgi:hypothetical protein